MFYLSMYECADKKHYYDMRKQRKSEYSAAAQACGVKAVISLITDDEKLLWIITNLHVLMNVWPLDSIFDS